MKNANKLSILFFSFAVSFLTEPICIFQLDYIHKHEKFYFLYPPQLTIFELQAIMLRIATRTMK